MTMTRRDLITGRGRSWVATAEAAPASAARRYGAEYFSNVTLTTHEGRTVRFYDDLIRGKIVMFNMMYAQCDDICPITTDNLVRVQSLLGPRVGRDVFMYSITLDPKQDTPQDLKVYAAVHGVKPGWQFLTGSPADIRFVRYRLGFSDPDPAVDGRKATHTGALRIGNDVYERWAMAPALTGPEHILSTVNHVDRAVVTTAPRR
jgi:protein SCO1/2